MEEINMEAIQSKFIEQPATMPKTEKPQRALIFNTPDKTSEEKMYIILYKLNLNDEDDEAFTNIFSICIGRTEAYLDIKTKLISGFDIDIHRSVIMTETKQTETETGDTKYYMIPYNECISVYAFCIAFKDTFEDKAEFNIEDYNTEENIPDAMEEFSQQHPTFLTSDQLRYREMIKNDPLYRIIRNGDMTMRQDLDDTSNKNNV